jgi:hypothetical protein
MTLIGSSNLDDVSVTDRLIHTVSSTSDLLTTIPDTFFIIVLGLTVAVLAIRQQRLTEQMEIAVFVTLSGLAFAVLNPLLTYGIPLLPRYYIGIVPVVVVGIVAQLASSSRLLAGLTAGLIATVFLVNSFGALYPYKDHELYAIAERSFEYQNLLELQKQGITLLEELGRSRPIYYDFYRHFQFTYPEMGYTAGPSQMGGSSVFHSELSLEVDDLPDRFALLFEYPTLGGQQLAEIWRNAIDSGARVRETRLSRGNYSIYVIEVDR